MGKLETTLCLLRRENEILLAMKKGVLEQVNIMVLVAINIRW